MTEHSDLKRKVIAATNALSRARYFAARCGSAQTEAAEKRVVACRDALSRARQDLRDEQEREMNV